jgi:hypothetical protein
MTPQVQPAIAAISKSLADISTTLSHGMAPTPALSPVSLLTATAGLIAFHIGLFGLIGNQRKSPYVINLLFSIFLLCLVSATCAVFASIVPPPISAWALIAGAISLLWAFVKSAASVYRISARLIHFVDGLKFRQLPIIRNVNRWLKFRKPVTYEHNADEVPANLVNDIVAMLPKKAEELPPKGSTVRSIGLQIAKTDAADELLAKMAIAFLKAGFFVQYLTASRHPIEFIDVLKAKCDVVLPGDWNRLANKIVTIDGYSPHFAFLDSIYHRKDYELKRSNIIPMTAKMTFAGLHTAASNAFNEIKRRAKDAIRGPTLVIYDGCYALSDLESAEQYRNFVRHVLPSERLWSGMLTIVVESFIAEQDWKLLRSYVTLDIDMTSNGKGTET